MDVGRAAGLVATGLVRVERSLGRVAQRLVRGAQSSGHSARRLVHSAQALVHGVQRCFHSAQRLGRVDQRGCTCTADVGGEVEDTISHLKLQILDFKSQRPPPPPTHSPSTPPAPPTTAGAVCTGDKETQQRPPRVSFGGLCGRPTKEGRDRVFPRWRVPFGAEAPIPSAFGGVGAAPVRCRHE
jgi:hypothetical protein